MGWRDITLPACFRCCRKKTFQIKDLPTENSENSSDQNNPERENWSHKSDYLLSLIGYAVGLGNVWRFPYLAFQNGGGAFLLPYTIMLAFAGLPLFFMECSLGQFCSLGPIAVWKIVPILEGVGVTMVLISALVGIYYNVIIAYSLYYLFASFRSVLPWADCYEWADENCARSNPAECNTTMGFANTSLENLNCSTGSNNTDALELPSSQYWNKVALRRSSGLDETGQIVWYLALCLLLAWLLVGAALVKGIKSSGKVVYFTAVFPYVVLIILLVRGATLEGAVDGISFFIGSKSDIAKLSRAEGWKDAATQIFYSLSTAWGGLVALSSYNKFRNNCYLDSIVVCVINFFTSVLAGFVIFSVLGHMAFVSGKTVQTVVKEGFDLAFVVYPYALTKLPVSPLWAILFFCMLLSLGLDSQFALIETITTSIQDSFPEMMKRFRILITAGCCIILFLPGLVCVTQAGIYWVNLIDYFTGGWALLIAAVLELVGICWIYGVNRFIDDIEMMLGKKHWIFWLWWRACWFFISPVLLMASLLQNKSYVGVHWEKLMITIEDVVWLLVNLFAATKGLGRSQLHEFIVGFLICSLTLRLLVVVIACNMSSSKVILVWSLVTFVAPTYDGIEYPAWGIALGWLMIVFCVIWIPILAAKKIYQSEGSLWQRIVKCSRPTADYGPALPQNRGERYKHMKDPKQKTDCKDLEMPAVIGTDNPSFQHE